VVLRRADFLKRIAAGAAIILLPVPKWLPRLIEEEPFLRVTCFARITCADGSVLVCPVVEHIAMEQGAERHFELVATDAINPVKTEFFLDDRQVGRTHDIGLSPGGIILAPGDTLSLTWVLHVE
jgi:hypothetical protein